MTLRDNTWYQYRKGQDINTNFDTTGKIIQRLGAISMQASEKSRVFTNRVKYELIMLGYENGYCVYTCLKKKNKSNFEKVIMDNKVKQINTDIKDFIARYGLNDHTFKNREWLYDLHLYRDKTNTHYMPETLELIVESELGNLKRRGDKSNFGYSEVKYDFQKLLASNANIKLMIFSIENANKDLYSDKGLAKYFDDAISAYNQLISGSRFIFACYYKDTLLYKELFKNSNRLML